MPKLKKSPSDAAQFKAYKAESRWIKNKIARLERVVAIQPNNKPLIEKLVKAKAGKLTRHSGRKSNGHACSGMYTQLGFEKNQPSKNLAMTISKSKLPMNYFYGGEYKFTGKVMPMKHGSSIRDQLIELGYKLPRSSHGRKYKKTVR